MNMIRRTENNPNYCRKCAKRLPWPIIEEPERESTSTVEDSENIPSVLENVEPPTFVVRYQVRTDKLEITFPPPSLKDDTERTTNLPEGTLSRLGDWVNTASARLLCEDAAPSGNQTKPLVCSNKLNVPASDPPKVDDSKKFTTAPSAVRRKTKENKNRKNEAEKENRVREPGILSQRIGTEARLRDIISEPSIQLDHPICQVCTDTLIEYVDEEFQLVDGETVDYQEYLKKHVAIEGDDPEMKELQAELAKILAKERVLIEEEQKVVAERTTVFEERDLMRKEQKRLEESERRSFKGFMKAKHDWIKASELKSSLGNQVFAVERELASIESVKVMTTVFCITVDGAIGKINGFSLGNLTHLPVEYNEINVAWGQCALLLNALATRLKFKFEIYTLVPFGAASFIGDNSKNRRLPLYYLEGRKLGYYDFDLAMTAFLDCLSQLGKQVRRQDESFAFAHVMSGDSLCERDSDRTCSIKIQLNTKEKWTRALKFMLTNLNQILMLYP